MKPSLRLCALTLCAASAVGLVACGRSDPQTAANAPDTTVAKVERSAREAAQATENAAAAVADTARDLSITTKISAALAADDQLQLTRIDVDPKNGQVTLSGSAPSAAAKERATALAQSVEGVTGVDNRLNVQ